MVFDEENMVGNQHMVENDYKIKSSSTVKIWWQFSDVARINGEFEKNIDFNWLFLASKHGLIRNKYRCENELSILWWVASTEENLGIIPDGKGTGHDGNDHDLDTSIMLNPISAPFIIHLPSGND